VASHWRSGLAGVWIACLGVAAPAPGATPRGREATVIIDASAPVNSFVPDRALGAALDGTGRGEVARRLTAFNIARMRASGLKAIAYRIRPELGIEVWHWTDHGTWSDPARRQGYWTGSDDPDNRPKVTWGYSLPRRGDTVDNANNAGYSRIDDGDAASFWKSNPYLDRRLTGLAHSRPQWIVFSFPRLTRFDAARIYWGAPFARHFLVQYWAGKDGYEPGKQVADYPGGWKTFPSGDVSVGEKPGEGVLRLAPAPIASHFVRILMLTSSLTAPPGSTDIRDRLGFAVREVALGVLRDGRLVDAVRHGRSRRRQTMVQVSSTDPWHRAVDRDRATEQPGLDLVFGSGLGAGAPAMLPVGVLYDTPKDAAAEVRYVRRRGWPVGRIELGEEPDGQFIRPEDYADLYLETARALRKVAPGLSLGGPSLQGALTGTWPDTGEGRSWTGRFIAELKARGGLGELQFFSFEHYAFDRMCRPAGAMLRRETGRLDHIVAKLAASGVPRSIPWVISEYGFSPFSGAAMSKVPSALIDADIAGHFLSLGGAGAYMFGFTPARPANQDFACAGYGNMMLWEADGDGASRWPMPTFYGERMLMQDWGAPADAPHRLYRARIDPKDARSGPMVVAYPLRAPDGRWSVMLINRDAHSAVRVRIVLRGAGKPQPFAPGRAVDVVQYSPAEYAWGGRGEASRPTRDLPPRRFRSAGGSIELPALSLTIAASGAAALP